MPMSAFTGKQSKAFRFEAALTPCRPMHRDGVLGLARQAYTTPMYIFKIKKRLLRNISGRIQLLTQ